ncbi:polyamine aminopropyltransferase [Gallaecimonas sp. GXIMD4217]|uniref:polyamine aminopropyltransferase n=1 Tax=Gallaecimonas sp. GXIMD4217 TaxID=3131927 RepID=UPI00311AEA02
MSKLDGQNWFTEVHERDGSAFSLRVTAKLDSRQSEWQTTEIYETTDWGKLMVIDGCTMVSTRDNFLYHEMMSHPALYSHADPKTVVIIGGGDCGTLREVLKHPGVEKAIQIDIDENVTRLAEIHFPELCQSNGDPRAELKFIDGIQWTKDRESGSVDIIIVDSTDPVGPAEGLFNRAFYQQCLRVLGEGGILVQQSESPLLHLKLIQEMRAEMAAAGFDAFQTLPFPQPLYPSGWWSCTLARKGGDFGSFRVADADAQSFETLYYNSGVHQGAMALPNFMKKALKG